MIGGVIMILTTIWIYQTVVQLKTEKALLWVGGCAAIYLASQFLLIDFNVYILEAFRSSEGGANYERDLTSVGDRKNEGGFQGVGGILESLFLELMPPIAGFLIVAFIRLKFITKESFAVNTLFSGTKEMFINIKDSFKGTAN
jgi:hypothetical protein